MSDYLTDEEQIAKLKAWWEENGTGLVVGLILVIGGVIGWRWYDGYRTEQIESASTLYEEFLASEGEVREQLAASIDAQIPDTSYQVFTLLHRAHAAAEEADFATTEALLVRAVAAAPDALLADVARLRLARVLQQGDRSDDALAVLGAIRGEGFRSHVAELKGDIHLTRGETVLAHEAYSAALVELSKGEVRPMLEMKVADTAGVGDA
ncbi:MAG: tetratricopeptide repeat protein [Gammaproteobacteria bacterium]|nr:MAG: tetratricopeptide repeat protein [Gammaproteobacteria bacterium]TDJ41024.1 MAG: tetratricopeptide repeat protein [Gammaproteobacteria bacterium]